VKTSCTGIIESSLGCGRPFKC